VRLHDEWLDARRGVLADVRPDATPEACEPRRLKTARGEEGAQLHGVDEVPDGAWQPERGVEEEVPGVEEVDEDFEGFGWRDHCCVVLL